MKYIWEAYIVCLEKSEALNDVALILLNRWAKIRRITENQRYGINMCALEMYLAIPIP